MSVLELVTNQGNDARCRYANEIMETNEQNDSKVSEKKFQCRNSLCEKHLSDKTEDRCQNYLDRMKDNLILSCAHV